MLGFQADKCMVVIGLWVEKGNWSQLCQAYKQKKITYSYGYSRFVSKQRQLATVMLGLQAEKFK